MYSLLGQEQFRTDADKFTWGMEGVKNLTSHHDTGFMIGSSFLQGYRATSDTSYVPVIIDAARSLSTRFRNCAGVIQSWNTDRGWQSERGWQCPVIIDNMMNLELLFEASIQSGDNSFRDIAVIASGLLELYSFDGDKRWLKTADSIITSLSSTTYLAADGANGGFLLKHSAGSIPHGAEVDAPLVYADYYFSKPWRGAAGSLVSSKYSVYLSQ